MSWWPHSMSDLHFAHFVCLELRCAVVMDKANTACELQDEETGEGVSDHRHAWARGARGCPLWLRGTYRHCYGHASLSDGIHRGGNKWGLEGDLLGQGRGQVLQRSGPPMGYSASLTGTMWALPTGQHLPPSPPRCGLQDQVTMACPAH